MKEERLAILSMIEKGIISVEEATTLFSAIDRKSECSTAYKANRIFSKTGEGISEFAKKVSVATEKLMEDSKPAIKKAGEKIGEVVEDSKPIIKKAASSMAEKAEEFKKSRKTDTVEDVDIEYAQGEAEESDFEKDVIIIPIKQEETIEEVVAEETEE